MVIHSTFQYSYLWLPLIGLIVGLLATMVGGSGGSVFPPVLIVLFHIPPQVAIATSLAAAIPIGLVGTVGHHIKGNIQFKTGVIFIITGFAGAVTGAYITRLLEATLLKNILGSYMIVLGIFFFYSLIKKPPGATSVSASNNHKKNTFRSSVFGFLAGSATGLFGTSGTAPVLAGMFSLKLPVKIIAGTSLLIVFANSVSGFSGHFLAGQVDMTLVYLLASGSIIGSVAGPWILGLINVKKVDSFIQNPRQSFKYGLPGIFALMGILLILT